jgi:GxxExxY protein
MLRNRYQVVYPELSYLICGLCFKVHNELGQFRNEKQYADALEEKLRVSKMPFIREKGLPKSFEGEHHRRNIVDFLVGDKIVVEIKVKRALAREDYYQLKRYLVSSNKKLGILVNFGQKYLSPKRVLNSQYSPENS